MRRRLLSVSDHHPVVLANETGHSPFPFVSLTVVSGRVASDLLQCVA